MFHIFTKLRAIRLMIKKIRIALLIISLILSLTAMYTLSVNVPNNNLSMKDLPIIIYFLCIFITGILVFFPKLNYLMLGISIVLLTITIIVWLKYPQIGIIYTPFVVYLGFCLALGCYSLKKQHN